LETIPKKTAWARALGGVFGAKKKLCPNTHKIMSITMILGGKKKLHKVVKVNHLCYGLRR
jgi:hypothetical protein